MTSNRPYLIRAIYEWIGDNQLTPYLLVDASIPGVAVPAQAIKDGRVVLNVASRAVARLDLGNDQISFMARFSGVSQQVKVPVQAVLAIYAQETGQGMMLPRDDNELEPPPSPEPPEPTEDAPKRSHLRVVK
ncbi:ClpXP protease specificity-enhancing factor [Pseudomarimonas arenosa]|nr:ClpXP protease specificity-enhancing factor [Pseudomarimonas arenosa]